MSSSTPPPPPSPSPTVAGTPTAAAAPTPTAADPAAGFTTVDPAAFAVDGWEGVNFISPSRNLRCGVTRPTGSSKELLWGCNILQYNWEFPSSSPDDYCYDSQIRCGNGIEALGGEAPHPWQHGDPGIPAALPLGGPEYGEYDIATLQYGESVTYAGITCTSEEVHVTCVNADSGHGFVISRDENTIY